MPTLPAIILEVGYVEGQSAVVIVHAMPAREKFLRGSVMPRSVEEILQHAEELAPRFEDYEPDPGDELDPKAVTALRTAVLERSDAERHLLEAVRQARAAHLSWSAIGALVGTSGEAARQRYANKVA